MTLAIFAGIISGISSGVLAALVTPFAQRRAEETKERQAARRALIASARAMLEKASTDGWLFDEFMRDATFTALWPHLTDEVQREYGGQPVTHEGWNAPDVPHDSLREEIARIERGWNLV